MKLICQDFYELFLEPNDRFQGSLPWQVPQNPFTFRYNEAKKRLLASYFTLNGSFEKAQSLFTSVIPPRERRKGYLGRNSSLPGGFKRNQSLLHMEYPRATEKLLTLCKQSLLNFILNGGFGKDQSLFAFTIPQRPRGLSPL